MAAMKVGISLSATIVLLAFASVIIVVLFGASECDWFEKIASDDKKSRDLAKMLESYVNDTEQVQKLIGGHYRLNSLEVALVFPSEFGFSSLDNLDLIIVKESTGGIGRTIKAVGVGFSRVGIFFENLAKDGEAQLAVDPVLSCDINTPAGDRWFQNNWRQSSVPE